jgi:hypothetical protein
VTGVARVSEHIRMRASDLSKHRSALEFYSGLVFQVSSHVSGVRWVAGAIPFGGCCVEMEHSFKVEAKSFSFSAKPGSSTIRLEERRKGFGGSITLEFRYADCVADTVEEALLAQGTEDFAKSFREEVEVLRVSKGSNKAGNFLEVAVFAEGNRKRTIWLPEGRGGWGWRRFVGELRQLLVVGVAQIPTKVSGGTPTGDGASPDRTYVAVLTEAPGGMKPV